MNKRLDYAFETARRTLSEEAQEGLAAVVEEFVSRQAVDQGDAVTAEEDAAIERRLDAKFPAVDTAEHDRWVREKVRRAVAEADAQPGEGKSLSEIRARFGLEP